MALEPRAFQRDLADAAANRNVVIALDTGAGKTLISVMLMKILHQRWADADITSRRKIIFLANFSALVDQQAKVIQENSDLTVARFSGDRQISDRWCEKAWQETFESHDVVVLTAQLFLDIVQRAYISMEDVGLLIIDEAHHAAKNHPYAVLFRDHYHLMKGRRPKVFGMSASPIDVKLRRNFQRTDEISYEALLDLETLMEATVITPERTDSLLMHVVHSSVSPIEYWPSHVAREANRLRKRVESADGHSDVGVDGNDIRNWKMSLVNIFEELGKEATAGFCRNITAALTEKLDITRLCSGIPSEAELKDMISFCDHVLELTQSIRTQRTDKLIRLTETLLDVYRAERNFQGIIFVQTRAMAAALQQFYEKGMPFKSKAIVGSGKKLLEEGFGFERSLERFRLGEISVLIATNVAEEGLDIPTCNLMIRFDLPARLIASIQSKGRARKKDSKIFWMMEVDNSSQKQKLRDQQVAEIVMRELITNRTNLNASSAEEKLSFRQAQNEVYIAPSTGSKVSLDDAIATVEHYCASLPVTPYVKNQAVAKVLEFDMSPLPCGFKCTYNLPTCSRLREEVCGTMQNTKKRAKQSAALMVCRQLHKEGGLDDFFRPESWSPKKSPQIGAMPGSKSSIREYDPRLIPESWSPESLRASEHTSYYLHKLEISSSENALASSYMPFAYLLPSPLKALAKMKCSLRGKICFLQITFIKRIDLPCDRLLDFIKYYESLLRLVKENVAENRRSVPEVMVLPMGVVEAKIEKPQLQPVGDYKTLADIQRACRGQIIITMPYRRTSVLFGVTPATETGDILIQNSLQSKLDSDKTGSTSSETLAHYNERTLAIKHSRKAPILVVEKATDGFRNIFVPQDVTAHIPPTPPSASEIPERILCATSNESPVEVDLPYVARYVHPDQCQIYPLPVEALRSIEIYPAVLRRIELLYHVRRFKTDYHLKDVSDMKILEALTLPEADPSLNYEMLETYGDAFLKMAASNCVYCDDRQAHEGILTDRKSDLVSNPTLYDRATEPQHNLVMHVIDEKFIPRLWRPPGYRQSSSPQRKLSDKTIADVVEAVIGAILSEKGPQRAIDFMVHMEVLPKQHFWNVGTSLPDRELILENMPLAEQLKFKPIIEHVEQLFGYRFNDPSLIVEAMTHASYGEGFSYQRLEFLGDAVLDWFATQYIVTRYAREKPKHITEMRQTAVCANTIAAISDKWKLPLHMLSGYDLRAAIGKSSERITKIKSDLVESVLGAFFIDAQRDWDLVYPTLLRLIEPEYETLLANKSDHKNEAARFYELLHSAACRASARSGLQIKSEPNGRHSALVRWSVTLHDTRLVETENSNKQDAAKLAYRKIMSNGGATYVRALCKCPPA